MIDNPNAPRYYPSMIASFADDRTEALFNRERVKGLDMSVQRVALRRLRMIDAAVSLEDLRVPSGNRLEALKGRWKGYHSIRVNDQWRIVFKWRAGQAHEVAIVDYH